MLAKDSYFLSDLERKEVLLPHHIAGLQYTRSGYGGKIPTTHMVRLPNDKRWRRVYMMIWSNAGTSYVIRGNEKVVIL